MVGHDVPLNQVNYFFVFVLKYRFIILFCQKGLFGSGTNKHTERFNIGSER